MEIYTDILIEATPQSVWNILINFSRYPHWNPFLTEVLGEAVEGAGIEIEVSPPGLKKMRFKPCITSVEPCRQLTWVGKFAIPYVFDGEHSFVIEPVSDRAVRFIQKETYTGLVVPFYAKSLNQNTREGFHQMNQALKDAAEQVAYSTV